MFGETGRHLEGLRLVEACPEDLSVAIREWATGLGVKSSRCTNTEELLIEGSRRDAAVVLSWQVITGDRVLPVVPICQQLRNRGSKAYIICLNSPDPACGGAGCMGNKVIVSPRSPKGMVDLLAGIREAFEPNACQAAHDTIQLGSLYINVDQRTVLQNGERIALTKGQYDLLIALVRANRRVVPFRELHAIGCGVSSWNGDTRPIRQQLSKLMRKLGTSDAIQNVRGVGYVCPLPPAVV